MRARRANGQGSVYLNKEKGRWMAAMPLPPHADGKKRVRRKTCLTKGQAHKALIEMQGLAQKNLLTQSISTTVKTYSEHWFKDILPLRGLKPSTHSNYYQMLHYYILPLIGSKRLVDIRPQNVLEMVNNLKKRGLRTSTIRGARRILHNMMESAVAEELITSNPVTALSSIKKPEDETSMVQKSYTSEEVRRALELLQDTPYLGLVRCMALLGLRIGEVIGMRWDQINFEEKEIWISRSEANIAVAVGDGTWKYTRVAGTTKSNRKRKLLLTDEQETFLKQHRRKQKEKRLKYGSSWNPLDHIFVTESGTPFASNNVSRAVKKIFDKNGLRHIRFHDLRHTAGFLLSEKGVDLGDICDMLGHADIQTTKNIYIGHVQIGSDRAVRGLEEYILAEGSRRVPKKVSNN
jgi:integrase